MGRSGACQVAGKLGGKWEVERTTTDPALIGPSGVAASRLTEVIVPSPASVPPLSKQRPRPRPALPPLVEGAHLHVVPWPDPVADPHGVHPCSRYVELYWLGIIGPPKYLLGPVVKERGGCDDPERDHASRHIFPHQP
jgi:hypothetical protein